MTTLKSSGVLKKFQSLFSEFLEVHELSPNSHNEDNTVTIDSLKSIFVTISILYIVSLIMLFGEIIFYKGKNFLSLLGFSTKSDTTQSRSARALAWQGGFSAFNLERTKWLDNRQAPACRSTKLRTRAEPPLFKQRIQTA